MKREEKKEFNLKLFLESPKYELLKNELNRNLNHNTQFVNIEIGTIKLGSNIKENYLLTFKKSKQERKQLKEEKSLYNKYKNTDDHTRRRESIIAAFVMNLKFCKNNVQFTFIDNRLN